MSEPSTPPSTPPPPAGSPSGAGPRLPSVPFGPGSSPTAAELGLARAARSRLIRLVAGLLLIVESWALATFLRVPYITLEPGSATNVVDLISVDGADAHPPHGELLFLTVSLSHRLTPAEAVLEWLGGDGQIVKERVFTGNLSREELTRINLRAMEQSKLVAIAVALEHLGHDVVEGRGALITEVLPDRPVSTILEVDDVIVAVGGEPVRRAPQVIDVVRDMRPGDAINLTVRRGSEELTVDVPTVDSDGVAQIGVSLLTSIEFDFPFSVDIDTGQVGGPSAGLAFTLAVLDELTEGELTGGNRVAVTGAIDEAGRVEPVGGVEQKTVAARRAGAALMLVPAGEVADASGHAGDMQVVGVADLDEALAALDAIGGNALALPTLDGSPSARG